MTGENLVKPGVKVVFPNPKTSGNGRYSYLAAYAYALSQNGANDAKAREFMGQLLANVPVFDTMLWWPVTTRAPRRASRLCR